MDPYFNREQTLAKHDILKHYLQELAFKILRFSDLTFVDGFSGPWESKTEDFSDTSFKIALNALQEAQDVITAQTGTRRNVRCFFSEADENSYALLQAAVTPFHDERRLFQIKTFKGNFEDAVTEIQNFTIGFSLVFIDPTGWTGYAFPKISPILRRGKCEVVVNFMYSFVSRFLLHPDQKIINSLDPVDSNSKCNFP